MGLACSACGFRAENRAFFRKEKTAFFGFTRSFCLGCKPLPKAKTGFVTLGVSGALALAGWLATAINQGLEPFGLCLAAISGLLALSPLGIAAHEAGHAAVAALLGLHVYQINVGSGLPLKTIRIQGTTIIIGRDMGAGYVISLPKQRESRWRRAVILLAGAVANFIAAVFLVFLAGAVGAAEGSQTTWSAGIVCIFCGAAFGNVMMGVNALVPKYQMIEGRLLPSDGSRLLELLRQWRVEEPNWQVHHDAFKGGELLQAKLWDEAEAHYRNIFSTHPDQPGFLAVLLHVLALTKGPEIAMACAMEHEPFLRRDDQIAEPMAPMWSYVWAMAAWAILRTSGGDLVLAEDFSRRAAEADPTSACARAVRGATLVRSGRRTDGLDIILNSLKDMRGPSDKLEFCDFMIAQDLQGPDLTRSDFEALAAHLRILAA